MSEFPEKVETPRTPSGSGPNPPPCVVSATSGASGCHQRSHVPNTPPHLLPLLTASSFRRLPTPAGSGRAVSHTSRLPPCGTAPEAGQVEALPAVLYSHTQREQL